jgi:1-acyl-sn-glycerol-3-phosphate acyltransferase
MDLTYRIAHSITRALVSSFYHFRIIGSEHMDFTGGAILASNHISFLDPLIVGQAVDQSIHYFARKTLFSHPLAGKILRAWGTIPIDRERPDAASLKTTIRLLRRGERVLMFPEGTRSTEGQLLNAEAGIGLFIAKTGAPVLPIRLYGTYQALPRGAHFLRPAQITMVVGQLYQPEISKEANNREVYQQLADEVMLRIQSLTC